MNNSKTTHCLNASLLAATLVLAPWPAAAQTQPADPPVARFTTEVLVTPERRETPSAETAGATVLLEGPAIQLLPAAHPSELVAFIPGFQVARSQFHAGRPLISARGFFGGGEAEYVLLLVDGVPVRDVESGLIDWSTVPMTSIRRVEAYRGPGASVYGDSAIGGVLQILTDRTATGGLLTVAGGSFRTLMTDGSYAHRAGAVGLTVSGAARRTDGGFDHSYGDQVTAAASADGAFRRFTWRWNVTGGSRTQDDSGALDRDVLATAPYTSDPIYRFDTMDRQSVTTSFVLRHDNTTWRPQARLYSSHRSEDLIRTLPLVPGVSDSRARALSSAAFGGSIEGEHLYPSSRPVLLRFGTDVSRERLDTTYRSVTPAGEPDDFNSAASGYRVRSALFASASWEASPRVRVVGALRWDHVNDNDFLAAPAGDGGVLRAWSPRLGVVVPITADGSVTAFGQISRAFKAPTLDQRFDPRPYPDFQGGTLSISNPALLPQRATNVEAGVRHGDGPVRWSALGYHMLVDDEIDFDLRTFSYGNIGESRHTGVELEAEGRWWPRARPSITYALTRVVAVDSSRQIKNLPPHALTLGLAADLPWRLQAVARYRHTRGGYLDDDNLLSMDGPSTLDIRARREVGRHALFVDVLNATGNHYEEYGFTLSDFFGGVVPYAYPGAPRAARAGLTLSF